MSTEQLTLKPARRARTDWEDVLQPWLERPLYTEWVYPTSDEQDAMNAKRGLRFQARSHGFDIHAYPNHEHTKLYVQLVPNKKLKAEPPAPPAPQFFCAGGCGAAAEAEGSWCPLCDAEFREDYRVFVARRLRPDEVKAHVELLAQTLAKGGAR